MECCRVDDTSPENTIVGHLSNSVDTDVCRLYIGINPPQPGSYTGALEVSSSLLLVGSSEALHFLLDEVDA